MLCLGILYALLQCNTDGECCHREGKHISCLVKYQSIDRKTYTDFHGQEASNSS